MTPYEVTGKNKTKIINYVCVKKTNFDITRQSILHYIILGKPVGFYSWIYPASFG